MYFREYTDEDLTIQAVEKAYAGFYSRCRKTNIEMTSHI
jgi:hypothetical protein